MDGYIGQIIMFSGYRIPRGWKVCNGEALAIREYTALYSIIGTIYGGDNKSVFNLPKIVHNGDDGIKYIICSYGLYPDFE